MSLKYKLSKLALEDIDTIWDFTVINCSIVQAEKYYQQIFESIITICQNPMIGKSINEIKEKHRKMLVGSHMIIYKQEENLILIDRILHQKMDIENRLME